MNPNNLRGTALITGASTGIGATYADRLARRGYDLILVARDQSRLQVLAERLRAETGVKVDVLKADLIDKVELASVEQRLRDDETITLLVNNAGMAAAGGLLGGDIEQLDRMIQLNTVAPTRLAHALAPGLVARGKGGIINIASVLALAPEMFGGTYSGTKAFMLNFSLALHGELAPHGAWSQAVLPGATATEIWDRSGTGIENIPAEIIMSVDEMVDAALAGLDMGERVTIPSLPDIAQWESFNQARQALGPHLSLKHAAARYRRATAEAV
ncbi:MAG: SDR family oxidoreductase [Dyella sp.]